MPSSVHGVSELLVVTGPPGAGKSTVAEALVAGFEPGALVPGDDFFDFIRTGRLAPWLPESHPQNETITRAAAAAAGRLADGGYFVVFDGVVGPWFLPTFAAAAGGALLHYAVLMPSERTCLARVANTFDNSAAEPGETAAAIRERLAAGTLAYSA
jgi:hypothetical protein